MACIGKITSQLAMYCGAPARSDLGKPVGAKVINASDIASFTVTELDGAKITLIPGAVGYDVTAVNDSLVVAIGLKSQDVTPGAWDVTISLKTFGGSFTLASRPTPLGAVGLLPGAELVIAVDHGDVVRVYGLGAPLVCTEVSGDSSESAYATYAFGVEDWQVGTTIHILSRAGYDALSTPQPAPTPEE